MYISTGGVLFIGFIFLCMLDNNKCKCDNKPNEHHIYEFERKDRKDRKDREVEEKGRENEYFEKMEIKYAKELKDEEHKSISKQSLRRNKS